MFNGNRKLVLGLLYLASATFLGCEGIARGMDGMGIGLLFTGLATGIGAVVYGNVKEHQAKNGNGHGNGKT